MNAKRFLCIVTGGLILLAMTVVMAVCAPIAPDLAVHIVVGAIVFAVGAALGDIFYCWFFG